MNPDFVAFVSQWTNRQPNELTPELKLANDLGIYGLDAIYFMEEFFTAFQIKNTDNFDSNLYLDGGPDFSTPFIDKLKNIFIKERRKYLTPDISLGHLNKVMEYSTWIDSE